MLNKEKGARRKAKGERGKTVFRIQYSEYRIKPEKQTILDTGSAFANASARQVGETSVGLWKNT